MDNLEEKILNFTLDEKKSDKDDNLLESKIENITSKFYDLVTLQYSILNSIWTEIGLTNIKIDYRIDEINEILNEGLNGILDSVIKEENKTLNKLREFKKKKLTELNNFLIDLDLKEFDLNYNLPLLSQIKKILFKLQEIHEIKIERLEEWNMLVKKFDLLNKKLDLNVKLKYEKSVPTFYEINKLKKDIELNESYLKNNQKLFTIIQPDIVKLFDQLEIEPKDKFEEIVLNNNKNEFIFSQVNLKKLEDLKKELCLQIEKNKLKIEELKQNYINLSNLVFIKQDVIDEFLYLNGQKTSKLENELKKLKSMYIDNREIYEKLNEWIKDATELSKLEINNNDPNRFKNRGCRLLKDEQKRNFLRKKINKLDYDLKILTSKLMNEENKNILIYDYTINDYLYKLRTELHLTNVNEKKNGISSRVINYSSMTINKKDQTILNSVCKTPLHNIHMRTIKKSFTNKSTLNCFKTSLKKNKENAFDVSSLLRKINEIDQSSFKLQKSRLPLSIKSNKDQ